jgi:hypothetical protein
MAQVLHDLLAEQTNGRDRLKVWLRISSELPLSIICENVRSLRTEDVGLVVLKKNIRPVVTIAAALAIIILPASAEAFQARVLPDVAGVFFRASITQAFSAQNEIMGNPIRSLADPPTTTYDCEVLATQGIRTEIGCRAGASAYIKLDDAGSKSLVMSKVAAVEASLKQAGYQPSGNGATLASLVSGTYDGKDYGPGAGYQKVVGKYHCVFDIGVAYRNPAPAAVSMHTRCTRTINILGVPSTATYQSTKGLPR